MEDQVIDIYEKYANLFKIRVTPKIKKVYQLPYEESAKHPIAVRNGQDTCLTITGDDRYKQVAPDSITVKNIIRTAVCSKVSANPNFNLASFKTQIIDKKNVLKEYGDKTAVVYPGCEFRIINIGSEFFLCIDFKHGGIVSLSRDSSMTEKKRSPRIDFNPDYDFMTDLDSNYEEVFNNAIQIAKQKLEDPPFRHRNFQGEILLRHQGAVFKARDES